MFSPLPSITHDISLTEFIKRCQQHELVTGILESGSGGRKELKPYSDYDLTIVLREFPIELDVMLTTIDGRMSDIIFVKQSVIESMLTMTEYQGNTQEGLVFTWAREGIIHYDKTGVLARIKQSIASLAEVPEREKYDVWFRVNFNIAHTRRLLLSDDEVYLMAFDNRMLYMLSEVWLWFFTVRDIPWRGEKASIRLMQAQFSGALHHHQQAIHTTNRQKKFEAYIAFCRIALAPVGGVWMNEQVTAFNKPNDQNPSDMMQLERFWTQILQID